MAIVSAWDYNEYEMIPALFWAIPIRSRMHADCRVSASEDLSEDVEIVPADMDPDASISFTVAYFLAFHVRSKTPQIVLTLLCTIPFWTSNDPRIA